MKKIYRKPLTKKKGNQLTIIGGSISEPLMVEGRRRRTWPPKQKGPSDKKSRM